MVLSWHIFPETLCFTATERMDKSNQPQIQPLPLSLQATLNHRSQLMTTTKGTSDMQRKYSTLGLKNARIQLAALELM